MFTSLNGWFTTDTGQTSYTTLDAAAFAETVAGLLGAGLPFNARQEHGIFTVELLAAPPMTDSHEAPAAELPNDILDQLAIWTITADLTAMQAIDALAEVAIALGITPDQMAMYMRTAIEEAQVRQCLADQSTDLTIQLDVVFDNLARSMRGFWENVATTASQLAENLAKQEDQNPGPPQNHGHLP